MRAGINKMTSMSTNVKQMKEEHDSPSALVAATRTRNVPTDVDQPMNHHHPRLMV